MGTNYYHHTDVCKHCDRPGEIRHIGKSSMGWSFSFHGYPEEGIRTYDDWLVILGAILSSKIVDEYNREISLADFKAMVETKKSANHNHAAEYPDGCWRDEDGHSFSGHDFS